MSGLSCFWAALTLWHMLSTEPSRLPLHRQRATFSWRLTGKPRTVFCTTIFTIPSFSSCFSRSQTALWISSLQLRERERVISLLGLNCPVLRLGKECQAKTRAKWITSLMFLYSEISQSSDSDCPIHRNGSLIYSVPLYTYSQAVE